MCHVELHYLFPFLKGQLGGICSVRGQSEATVIFQDTHNPHCAITDRAFKYFA